MFWGPTVSFFHDWGSFSALITHGRRNKSCILEQESEFEVPPKGQKIKITLAKRMGTQLQLMFFIGCHPEETNRRADPGKQDSQIGGR